MTTTPKEAVGDMWGVAKDFDAICCTANAVVKKDGKLTMGKGVALQFAQRYPFLPKVWGGQIARFKEGVDPLILVSRIGRQYAIYFQTKRDWRQPADIRLITNSLTKLGEMVVRLNLTSVLLPRPGCENGGLNWEDVRKELSAYADFSQYPYSVITFVGRPE